MAKKETEQTEISAPYELPDGWKWTDVGSIAEIINGKSQKEVEDDNGLYPIYGSGGIIGRARDFICPENCTIIGRKGTINNPIFVETKFWNVDTAFGMKPFDSVNPKFYFYFCKNFNFSTLDSSTAIPSLTKTNIQKIPFPLPPLSEQKRIVSRIESMFAKLDEATEKAESALESFETRKAAILHKAFTGELTAKWRKENGVKDDSWEEKRLEDVCEKIVCGKTPKEFISTTGDIPYLKVYNISNNKIDFETTPQFIPKEIHEGKLASSILKPYDVIMNIVGPPLRKIAIIPEDYPEWNMNQAIVRFRPLNEVNYKYLYWALINPETLSSVVEETRGVVGQQNISVSQSRNLIIPVPTLSEQQEIVRILDSVLEKEADAKSAAERVLEQIDLLKKSILARAFRGEL